ncbi:hypothetical protein [Caulobacter sp. NIBR1757]|uniref:hypothetical protein n=1 Tax=Caulobacter sp. NIBR1757 TaxID=3016000 RepID=UPI0022F0DEF2|nr:hypothetical protein [Caulobacter sp. NIBR1757]WGM40833.1 hypothetical protein AMEJIAPC_03780 [Caulobacter sp. NIBR1757]
MSKTPIPAPPMTMAQLRKRLDETLANGHQPKDLVLRITLRDTALIKRSAVFADDDIRFVDGVMHVLGIPTIVGQVGETSIAAAEPADS